MVDSVWGEEGMEWIFHGEKVCVCIHGVMS